MAGRADLEPDNASAPSNRPLWQIWAVGFVDRRWTTHVVQVHESSSSDAPVYYKVVAEVPPAPEQGKSYTKH
uniref:OSJNBa0032N05.1 protein n=2 Tax=Oryza sativa subsp. japonica TaxID=39947 RepID=Q7X7C5_ORYSJ|nr:OSJNBa0022F16.26 [Oryza sativa Japonica Group]CAE05573.3 OSJNBa0032N05.1 [Oryza sativa Japonica Group]